MQYMLLIYTREADRSNHTPADGVAMMNEYQGLSRDLVASGHFKSGAALQATTSATTVRVRDGKTVTTDGPFAETREQLGGYYLIEAKDLDEAIAIAARVPDARLGSVEVRPVMTFPAASHAQ